MFRKYIALEGADGCGKTTLAKNFAELIDAKFVYEPDGSTPVTKSLRNFCLQEDYSLEVNWRAREYMLLATRAISTKLVKEYLETHNVVTDRSLISGMVYAHVASHMRFEDWWEMARKAFWCLPSHVVYVESSSQKIDVVDGDIYDNANSDFHEKIKGTFPLALKFFEELCRIKVVKFDNDFNKSPEHNAIRLETIINDLEGDVR